MAVNAAWPGAATRAILRYRYPGLLVIFMLVGCTSVPAVTRIALLAPFEGRYREIGYDALYAARLALQDAGSDHIELLPIDDGGTPTSAVDRARALHADPQVAAVILLGYAATAPPTLAALQDIPYLIVGNWDAQPAGNRAYLLTYPISAVNFTVPARVEVTTAAQLEAPLIGGEVLALRQFSRLRPSLAGVTILSSATLPDQDFIERYRSSDPFAPEPGLLAPLTYDALRLITQTVSQGSGQRNQTAQALAQMVYNGINGPIQFEAGYWLDAPVHRYGYRSDGSLTPLDQAVE